MKDKKKKKFFDRFGDEEEAKKTIRKGTGQKDPYKRPDDCKEKLGVSQRSLYEEIDRANKGKKGYADGGTKMKCKRAALMKMMKKRDK